MPRVLLLLVFIFMIPFHYKADGIKKGFEALSIFDYFKARTLFNKANKKAYKASACYGLALIYQRQDNPFSNNDSASKYINLAYNLFEEDPFQHKTLSGFKFEKAVLLKLTTQVAQQHLQKIMLHPTITKLDKFLRQCYLADPSLLQQAIQKRDALEMEHLKQINRSDSTAWFIKLHPNAMVHSKAQLLYEEQIFNELTHSGTKQDLIHFLSTQPKNHLRKKAIQQLFDVLIASKDKEGLAYFVNHFPQALQINEAWKFLFSLSVQEYSAITLQTFLQSFPNFPLKNTILAEIALSKQIFIPIQINDLYGYIDTLGNTRIAAIFEQASPFYEEVAVVSFGDSSWYINKQGKNVFNRKFEEAFPFHDNFAPVKLNNVWYFINHVGQVVSDTFQDVSALKNERYIIQKNQLFGAMDSKLQMVIEPAFEKLGDFENGYAYYQQDGKYGFINHLGFRSAADLDWISSFNEEGIALYRKQNSFGLISQKRKWTLPAEYEQIISINPQIYLVIKNGKYGFYSHTGCFIFLPIYEYDKNIPPQDYTNGFLFNLRKKKKSTLVNDLGIPCFSADNTPDEYWLGHNYLFLARKGKKFGYINAKGITEIPFKYSEGSDFNGNLALVRDKELYKLINRLGIEIISSSEKPVTVANHYWLIQNEGQILIHQSGRVIATNVINTQVVDDWIIATTTDQKTIVVRQ